MNLKDIEIKQSYRTSTDNIPKDFYVPILSQAIFYKRAVGFFSSSILSKISTGIANLANNNGKIQLVASPYLSDEDIAAMRKGYDTRDILRNAVMRELIEPQTSFEKKCLNQLANLIANNILDIKIAYTENNREIGMYHEKMGLISDIDGNIVAFSGSMNETLTAVTLNYESIDVFCSWKNIEQHDRVKDKLATFSAIWNNIEPGICVLNFPELNDEIIKKYKRETILQYENYNDDVDEKKQIVSKSQRNGAIIPVDINLRPYQIDAIDEWERKGFRGIFDMATGTGKTLTGLGAVARLCETLDDKLALIIVCPYQHLVEQWVEDIKRFNINPIIGFSAAAYKDYPKKLESAILDQKLGVRNKEFFCFICTNATFSLDKVQSMLSKICKDTLLLIDEAHNFGAERLSNLLSERYNYRLALSATLERHNDEEGTAKLYNFFGDKCINYPLEKAINEGKLTEYKYYPIITTLSEVELAEYSQLSYEISKCVIYDKKGKHRLSERGKHLALKRARLVAGASNKLLQLEEQIKPYVNDKHILVYCGATTILPIDKDFSDTDDDDIRQIDAVTDLLGNKFKMKVAQFTSREDVQKREVLKSRFDDGETMQALVAIKCLDEGVNIPKIKTVFILASTTNPKEYIQRRGRVLRLSEGKKLAEIYDFITLPRALDEVASITKENLKREISLVKNELVRAEEFARLAKNRITAEQIINQIKDACSINEYLIDNEEEY